MAVRARRRTGAAGIAFRVPAWAQVGGVVVVAAAVYYVLGRRLSAPWIFTDEFIYGEMARSFADSGDLLVRDVAWQNVPPLYPILISPAYALFSPVPTAYAAAKLINAVAMPLAAVPLYLLARRVLTPGFALLAAVLGLVVPSMLYTGTLMTENLFYPLFFAVVLALVLVLERPTFVRSAAVLAVCALAFLVRPQALAFVPAIVAAPVLLILFRRSGLQGLKAYVSLYGLTALILLPALAVQLARGRPISSLFGRYSFVGTQHYSPGRVAEWLLYHFAELDLYVGIVPFAALLVLILVVARLDARAQAFVAACVAVGFCTVLLAAAYASALTFVHRVHERYMFYVAPLLLIALLVWIEQGLPRPRRRAVGAAVVAAALPAVLPLQWMLNTSIVSDTLALIPWWHLDLQLESAAWTRVLLVAACLAAGSLFLFLPRRLRLVFPALALASLLVVMVFADRDWQRSSTRMRNAIGSADRDWIDQSVGSGASVAVLFTGHASAVAVWGTEFFNESVGPVYDLFARTPGDLPEALTTVDRAGALANVSASYGLTDQTAAFAGTRLATAGALTLYRLAQPPRLKTLVRGLYPNETWTGARASYTRYDCGGGRLLVGLASDPGLFISSKHVAVRTARGVLILRVPPTHPLEIPVRLVPRARTCRIGFTVRPAPPLSIPPGTPPRPIGISLTFP